MKLHDIFYYIELLLHICNYLKNKDICKLLSFGDVDILKIVYKRINWTYDLIGKYCHINVIKWLCYNECAIFNKDLYFLLIITKCIKYNNNAVRFLLKYYEHLSCSILNSDDTYLEVKSYTCITLKQSDRIVKMLVKNNNSLLKKLYKKEGFNNISIEQFCSLLVGESKVFKEFRHILYDDWRQITIWGERNHHVTKLLKTILLSGNCKLVDRYWLYLNAYYENSEFNVQDEIISKLVKRGKYDVLYKYWHMFLFERLCYWLIRCGKYDMFLTFYRPNILNKIRVPKSNIDKLQNLQRYDVLQYLTIES